MRRDRERDQIGGMMPRAASMPLPSPSAPGDEPRGGRVYGSDEMLRIYRQTSARGSFADLSQSALQ